MLTSEEVSKIERDFADGDTGWMGDRASLRALLKDRTELQAEIERLRAVVEAAREGCDTCHKYNGDDYCCDCYHAGSGTWAALAAWKEGK